MVNLDKTRKLRSAISSDVNTKKLVVDSLAIGKSSYDIEKDTGYPASTIRSFHRNNRELVEQRQKELEAIAPDIIADLQFKTKTSLELSKHKYRPDVFPNNTGYKDTQDIIAFQNSSSLSKQQIKALEKLNIFDTHRNLVISGNTQINQNINPSITKLVGQAMIDRLRNHKTIDVNREEIDIQADNGEEGS